MAMTPKEIIAVVQHFDAGGEVQFSGNQEVWADTKSPKWNFEEFHYRPKPKPLELWVNLPSGVGTGTAFLCQETAIACRSSKDLRTVHMREVVDEDS